MSTPVAILPDPEAEFFAQDPTVLNIDQVPANVWGDLPNDGKPYRTIDDVALGIGSAILIWHWLVRGQLLTRPTLTRVISASALDSVAFTVMKMTASYRRVLGQMLEPALRHAYALGSTGYMSQADQISYATLYSHQLADQVGQSSAHALANAFQAQLADRWNPDVAWNRAVGGYGLEKQSMSQYVKMLRAGEGREIIPMASKRFVEQALHKRAELIGNNEAHRALEMGKTIFWISEHQKGNLPRDARRRWLTAEDEKVCPVCGPMDHKTVGMEEKFTLPDGNELWAPGVHPNCRCAVELTYPELTVLKRFNPDQPRNDDGEWTRARSGHLLEVEDEPDQAVRAPGQLRRLVAPLAAPVSAPIVPAVAAPVTAPVVAPTTAPVTASVQAPTLAPHKEEVEVSSAHFFRTRRPFYAFANDLEEFRGERHAWLTDINYDVGDTVDLDALSQRTLKGETRFALKARHFPTPIRDSAEIASASYEDGGAYSYFDAIERDQYHAEAEKFYRQARYHAEEIIMNKSKLADLDVRSIFHMAGLRGEVVGRSPEDLRATLLSSVVNDGELRNTYFHYLEANKPDVVRGAESPSDYLWDHGLDPHIPTVFVFNRGFYGGYESSGVPEDMAHDVALIEGRYHVTRTEIHGTKPEMGSDAPTNVMAVKFAYLEPLSPHLRETEE